MGRIAEKKEHVVSTVAYNNLTPKQKEFFDIYVQTRAINPIQKQLGWSWKDLSLVYSSVGVQKALKEYNENIQETSAYNAAVIVDKLWLEYNDQETPKNVKINILVMLGKHIGMWANTVSQKDKKTVGNTTYNIVNYGAVKEEIDKNKTEVEKVKDQELDIPEGVTLADYTETKQ